MGIPEKKGGGQTFDASRTPAGFWFAPEDLVLVTDPAHKLYQKRRLELPVDEAIVERMVEFGWLGPPVAIWKDGEKALVVDGRQRVKAALEANKRRVKAGKEPFNAPTSVVKGDIVAAFRMMIACNKDRTDVDPMDEALEIQTYLELGHDENDAAALFGCAIKTVKNKQALLDLSKKVQNAVSAGRIGETVAIKELTKLPREEQDQRLTELLKDDTTKVKGRDVRKTVRAARGQADEPTRPPPKQMNIVVEVIDKHLKDGIGTETLGIEVLNGIAIGLRWAATGKDPSSYFAEFLFRASEAKADADAIALRAKLEKPQRKKRGKQLELA